MGYRGDDWMLEMTHAKKAGRRTMPSPAKAVTTAVPTLYSSLPPQLSLCIQPSPAARSRGQRTDRGVPPVIIQICCFYCMANCELAAKLCFEMSVLRIVCCRTSPVVSVLLNALCVMLCWNGLA